jgi:hypothetical protein
MTDPGRRLIKMWVHRRFPLVMRSILRAADLIINYSWIPRNSIA